MKRILSFIAIFALLAIFATTVTDARIKQCPGKAIISCCMDQSKAAYNLSYDTCDRSRYSDFQCKANADDAWMDRNRSCMSPIRILGVAGSTTPSFTIVIRNESATPSPLLLLTQQRGDFAGEVRVNNVIVSTARIGSLGTETIVYLNPGDNEITITITPDDASDLLAVYAGDPNSANE